MIAWAVLRLPRVSYLFFFSKEPHEFLLEVGCQRALAYGTVYLLHAPEATSVGFCAWCDGGIGGEAVGKDEDSSI